MRVIRTVLAAAVLTAAVLPAAASAGNQCDVKFYDGNPIPQLVC